MVMEKKNSFQSCFLICIILYDEKRMQVVQTPNMVSF